MIADLIIPDADGKPKHHGPHGFLIDFRRDGKVVDGVHLGDMVSATNHSHSCSVNVSYTSMDGQPARESQNNC